MTGWGGMSVPYYNPTLVHMPSDIHATPATFYPYTYSSSSSREATPSSTMSATRETYNALHLCDRTPTRRKRETQPKRYIVLLYNLLAFPYFPRPRSAEDARRLASLIDRCTKYVTAACKIHSCGQIFTDPNAYETHVNEDHSIPKGKNGDKKFPCPWDGCGRVSKQSSIWNHLMIHNMRMECCLCLTITPGTRCDTLKKHSRSIEDLKYDNFVLL